MARGVWYPPGMIYDGLLEPLLRGIRKTVRSLIIKYNLFPALDFCCGPGGQARRLAGEGRFCCGLDISFGMLKYAAGRRQDIPFVCADAALAPFRPASFKGVVISFALHEKPAELRPTLLGEAKRLLRPDGRIVLVDFEKPWDRASRLAGLYLWPIERLAGNDHFRNGRNFLASGGLRALLRENGLREAERRHIPAGACAVVVTEPR